jgi:hypothetical protein
MAAQKRAPDVPLTVAAGLAIVALMLVIYVASDLPRLNQYNHFVWQASAWLEGEAGIRYPVYGANGSPANDYFNDVMELQDAAGQPTGRALLPFPPLPAVILLPFVAVYGLATNAQLLATVLGALDVGIAFWMLGRLRLGRGVRAAVAVFFGLGTVFWYTAEKGTTWYIAHVVAVGLLLAAVGVALGGDPDAVDEALSDETDRDAFRPEHELDPGGSMTGATGESVARVVRMTALALVDRRQFLAGILFGLACTARLTVAFGAIFFVLVGSAGPWWRRGLSAALGAGIPLAILGLYNLVSTGHVFNPVYDYLYRQEAVGYAFLGYNADWSILDPRYIPQNLYLMLFGPPDVMPTTLDFGRQLCADPGSVRGWFDPDCPLIAPRSVGMGLLWTSPAYLLGLPALRRYGYSRLVAGAALAVLFVGFINVMHFSQGWVQFGYRFSLDFVPFALILVALGLHRLASRWPGRTLLLGGGLVGASIAVNFWGVVWGSLYGW